MRLTGTQRFSASGGDRITADSCPSRRSVVAWGNDSVAASSCWMLKEVKNATKACPMRSSCLNLSALMGWQGRRYGISNCYYYFARLEVDTVEKEWDEKPKAWREPFCYNRSLRFRFLEAPKSIVLLLCWLQHPTRTLSLSQISLATSASSEQSTATHGTGCRSESRLSSFSSLVGIETN